MNYIAREVGENPLLETKVESEILVDKKKRYIQIIEILQASDNPMSAKEIAVEMKERGYIPSTERNFSAPRITEMLNKGVLDCVGKKVCKYTGKTVGVFKIRENLERKEIQLKLDL